MKVTAPSPTELPELQDTFHPPANVSAAMVCVNTGGSVNVIVCVVSHPLASVANTVYVPAGTSDKFCVVAPLLHKNDKGSAYPLTITSTDPSDNPKHEISLPVKSRMASNVGSVSVTSSEAGGQLPLFVDVNVKVTEPLSISV